MSLRNSCIAYAEHVELIGLFSVLLVLGSLFVVVPSATLSSGTAVLNYEELVKLDNTSILLTVLFALSTLYVASFLTSALLIAVKTRAIRTDIASVFLHELLSAHTSRLFVFFTAYTILSLLITTIVPEQGSLVMLLISLPLLFVPAAIVLDEASITSSIEKSWTFLKKYPEKTAYYLVTGLALVLISGFIHYGFDQAAFIGKYASLTFTALFVLPFMLILQAELYLGKIGLLSKRRS